MVFINDKTLCCGCNACVQICPRESIYLQEDEEGFSYPAVNKATCINCKLCEKACPVSNSTPNTENVISSYAAYARDEEIRLNSSSGGIFSILAESILRGNGIVYGAAFDENFMVHHIAIDRIDELRLLRNSKYVQSRIENTFKKARENLENGKVVFYSGTACQIEGLKRFLGREYEKLFTIDILCHGVPSPKVWKKYLTKQENRHGAHATAVTFRKKTYGWKTYALEIKFNNAKVYRRIFPEDLFMQLFLNDTCLRPACHECRFKNLERSSDLTLGDAWGIQSIMPDMDDDKGTSIVLVHSHKGEKLLKEIESQLIIKEVAVDILLPPTADSRKPVAVKECRQQLFDKMDEARDIDSFYKLVSASKLSYIKWRIKNLIYYITGRQ